jgi:23S rRNA (cytosine1962-C5)-methyltransferase
VSGYRPTGKAAARGGKAKSAETTLILKAGREKSLLHGHPWVYSGAIERVEGSGRSGETVVVRSAGGEFLAWAAYSPASQIRARVWTHDEGETVDAGLLRRRLEAALALRKTLGVAQESDAYRLVHGESDGLPGLVVDRYGDALVMQALNAGIDAWREPLADLLMALSGAAHLYERSDVDVRSLEGLEPRVGALRGSPPPEPLIIQENGLSFQVDVQAGQKTGFYLDQRRNRQRLRTYAAGMDVLNCFCYTGGFTAYALAGGAQSVLSIDSSAEALRLAGDNLALNGLESARAEWLEADVFQALRKLRDQARSFDLIVLDPPKFAPTAAQAERAARGYKDINLLAFKLLRPGGLLFTFSCSGGVSAELFQKIVAGAAVDAHAEALILERLFQAPDHPVSLAFPEGSYLKGLVCQKMNN